MTQLIKVKPKENGQIAIQRHLTANLNINKSSMLALSSGLISECAKILKSNVKQALCGGDSFDNFKHFVDFYEKFRDQNDNQK